MKKVFKLLIFFLIALIGTAHSQEINITLLNPKFSVSSKDTFTLEIQTLNETAECKYSNSPLLKFEDIQSQKNIFINVDNHVHRIINFTDLENTENILRKIYIKCKTSQDIVNENESVEISLRVDSSPPVFLESGAEPSHVIERLKTNLIIEADDEISCRYDDTYDEYGNMRYTFEQEGIPVISLNNVSFSRVRKQELNQTTPIKIHDSENYTIFIACMNRAELISETTTVDFSVDLNAPNMILDYGPSGFVNGTKVELYIETNRDSVCYYGQNYQNKFSTEHKKTHKAEIYDLEEKKHEIPVKCIYDLGGSDGYKKIQFTVDNSPPENLTIETDTFVCNNDELKAEFEAKDNIGVSYYQYKIVDSMNNIVADWKNSDSGAEEDGLNLVYNREYYWVVKAVDTAGNPSAEIRSSGTVVYDQNHTECKMESLPVVSINTYDILNGKKVSLVCVDYGGACISRQYYVLYEDDPKCKSCSNCSFSYYTAPVDIYKTAEFCYKVEDNDGNVVEGSRMIQLTMECSSGNDGCCLGAEDNVCDEDCEINEDPDCTNKNITSNDKDYDGMPDAWELKYNLNSNDYYDYNKDPDNDGLTNFEEYNLTLVYGDSTNPMKADSDGDGFEDGDEVKKGTNPLDKNDAPVLTEEDKKKDTDGDGINDITEEECGLNPKDKRDAEKDYDNDGLNNKFECERGYKLRKADSDGDGFTDSEEYNKGTDPLNKEDTPKGSLLSVILYIFPVVIMIILISLFLMKKSKKTIPPAKRPAKITQDITQKQAQPLEQEQLPFQQEQVQENKKAESSEKKDIPKLDAGDKIFRRRHLLKNKKRDHLFDVFIDGQEKKQKTIKDKRIKKESSAKINKSAPKSIFQRLTELITENKTFIKLDILLKKKPQDSEKIDTLAKKQMEKSQDSLNKLDKLIKK